MTKVNIRDRLKTVFLVLGILVLLTTICTGIGLLGPMATIRGSEPYKHSVELALNSPEVHQVLGEGLTVGWITQGSVNASNGGVAQLYIPLRGTNDSASIRVNATNRNGTWKYFAIRVDTNGGDHIDLLDP